MLHLAGSLQRVLEDGDITTSATAFPVVGSVSPDKVYVLLDNASDPFLDHAQQHGFQELIAFINKARSVLWVSVAAEAGQEPGPGVHLVTGFTRVARRENEGMRLTSLLVPDGHGQTEYEDILRTIGRVIAVNFHRAADDRDGFYECEYVYRDGKVWVPRLSAADGYERWARARRTGSPAPAEMTAFGGEHDLALDVEQPGVVGSMRFVPLAREPLGSLEVEIQPECYVVTRADAFLASGGTDARLALSTEVAGTITAVGSGVVREKWGVGDRVVGFAAQAMSNRPRVPSTLVHHLPASVGFAAGVSVLYPLVSAAYAMLELTGVGRSHAVLVHGADSECGRAAVALARHLGADVFATVHDADGSGRRMLVQDFHLPANRVSSIQAGTYKDQILRLTQKSGVHVALNCSGRDVFRDTWACMANFGTLVDVVQPGGVACAVPPRKNATYVSFDLGAVIQHKPDVVGRLMGQVMAMLDQGHFKSIFSLSTKPITDLHDAFRQVQAGKTAARTVLEIHPGSLVKAVVASSPGEARLVEHATYIIAGGLGDIGQGMCRLLAARGARHVVILSRSGASRDPEKKDLLEKELAALGTHLYTTTCDVAHLDKVAAAADWLRASGLPPVRGVIQSAAVLRDRMLEAMDLDTFHSALRPKQQGTLNLMQCFESASLDFFIMLASAISALGTKGQANYAAGNTFQEGLAMWKTGVNRTRTTHTVTINPGLVAGTDADLYSPERRQILAKQGLSTIPFDEVMSAIDYSMSMEARADPCTQLIIGLDPDLLVKHDAAVNNRIYSKILQTAQEGPGNNNMAAASRSFDQRISAAEGREEVRSIVQEALTAKLAELLAMDPSDVRPHVPIADFGLDSLVAIEIKNWIVRSFKAAMQTADVLEAPSLTSLITVVLERSSLVGAYS